MPRVKSTTKNAQQPTDSMVPSPTYLPTASTVPSDVSDDRDSLVDAAYPELVRWKAKVLLPGDPQNPTEFCATHKITSQELTSLTRRPSYPDDVYAATMDWAKVRASEMFHALYLDAKNGGGPAAERFMKTLTEAARKATPTQTQVNVVFGGMEDEKFARIVSRALQSPPRDG